MYRTNFIFRFSINVMLNAWKKDTLAIICRKSLKQMSLRTAPRNLNHFNQTFSISSLDQLTFVVSVDH